MPRKKATNRNTFKTLQDAGEDWFKAYNNALNKVMPGLGSHRPSTPAKPKVYLSTATLYAVNLDAHTPSPNKKYLKGGVVSTHNPGTIIDRTRIVDMIIGRSVLERLVLTPHGAATCLGYV